MRWGAFQVSPNRQSEGNSPSSRPTTTDEVGILIESMDEGVIDTGIMGLRPITGACTITGWSLVADQVGSCVIDVKKCALGSYPSTSSICAGDKPTLSSAQSGSGSVDTWTVALAAGDLLEFVVDSASTITRVLLVLSITKG